MKVAVASNNQTDVASHTGRCRGFVIYEVAHGEARRIDYRCNAYTAHAKGECAGEPDTHADRGHHSHGPLLDALADCQALVARGMGPRLVLDLTQRGIAPYVCDIDDAQGAIAMFAQGLLPQATARHACRR